MPILPGFSDDSQPTLKTCSKCSRELPISEYYVKIKATGRRYSWCRSCHCARTSHAEQFRDEVAANEAIRQAARDAPAKTCKTCGIEKPKADFKKKSAVCKRCITANLDREALKATQKRYNDRHREKLKTKRLHRYYNDPRYGPEVQRKWREANPIAASSAVKRYVKTPKGKASMARQNHKRRIRVGSTVNDLTAEQWQQIIESQDYRCHYCGTAFGLLLNPTRDHIIPVSKGGGMTKRNIVAACQPCNSSKHIGELPRLSRMRPKPRRRPVRSTSA